MLFSNSRNAPLIQLTLSVGFIFLLINSSLLVLFNWWKWNNIIALFLITVVIVLLTINIGKAYLPFGLITIKKDDRVECDPEFIILMIDGRYIKFKTNCLPLQCKVFIGRRGVYDIIWRIKMNKKMQTYSDKINLYDSIATSETMIVDNE